MVPVSVCFQATATVRISHRRRTGAQLIVNAGRPPPFHADTIAAAIHAIAPSQDGRFGYYWLMLCRLIAGADARAGIIFALLHFATLMRI